MKKKQRIRYELAEWTRAHALLSTARDDHLAFSKSRYGLSSEGVGGLCVMGLMYSGGDYWV